MKMSKNLQTGFTLIEMIVSLAVFTTVVGISVGALLVLVGTNEQLQKEQSVMTNLSFALDSMTREIRTGVNYYCASGGSANSGPAGRKIFRDGDSLQVSPTQDCYQGNSSSLKYHGLSFIEGGQSVTKAVDTRIVYYFDNDMNSANQGKIMRRISGENAQSIVSSGIYIKNAEFFVTGSTPLSAGDENQSFVTIAIEAYDVSNPLKTYKIQTTVTQRTLDI